ncbi:uncharacterized protein LOC144149253 isoform X2 [Haemaphysalis longicornis]
MPLTIYTPSSKEPICHSSGAPRKRSGLRRLQGRQRCRQRSFLYTGRIRFGNVLEAAYTRTATHFFALPYLERVCTLYIHYNLTSATVCDLLDYMFLMNEHDVDDMALFILKHEGLDVLRSGGFAVAGRKTVEAVLKYVGNVKEAVVAQEVYKWVQRESRSSTKSGEGTLLNATLTDDVLSEVRFLCLTAEEFVEGPGTWTVLDPQEKCAILSNIVELDSVPLPAWVNTNTTARDEVLQNPERPKLEDSGNEDARMEQELRRMSEHTLGFFETGEGSDVTFIVTSDNFDDRRAIRAHRQYLALTNEGFQAMLLGDSAQLREVIVRDIHPDGFYNLIRYLYGGDPAFKDVLEAARTTTAARKFMVEGLELKSKQYITENLTPEHVCPVLDYLFEVKEVVIDDLLINIIKFDTKGVIDSEAFAHASLKTVQTVLRYASKVPETFLAERAYKWIEDNLAEHPDLFSKTNSPSADVLRELRLLTLRPIDFVYGPGEWDILDSEVRYALFSNIVREASSSLPNWVNENRRPRTPQP